MKKRIFISMVLLTVASLVFASAVLSLVFYSRFSGDICRELRENVEMLASESSQSIVAMFNGNKSIGTRVTVIAPDGAVVFDNALADGVFVNHIDREEVWEALDTGYGESKRFSDTLRDETYYCAARLADGYVLRLAQTSSSIFHMFGQSLPVVFGALLLIVIISYFAAGSLTARIIDPINSFDPAGEPTAPYDELAPFVRTIERQRRHIGEQLEDLESRNSTIGAMMENMREAIILLDRHGNIISLNKSAGAIFNADSDADGKNIRVLLRDTDLIAGVSTALSGSAAQADFERDDKIYRVFLSPVTGGGAIILLLDITAEAAAEKMRREFSANVSHELKTPLTSIYGYAEMLENGMIKPDDLGGFYTRIKTEASRLIALIEDIIMISMLDEGNTAQPPEMLRLEDIAATAVQSLAQKAAENNIAVSISGKAMARASAPMMSELFYNLLDNAIKYNKPGGEVKIDIREEKNAAEITVTDTGIGIPRELQGRVFERFFRVDKSRSKKTGGTGLGLAIVKHIAIVHGGTVKLESREGEGTRIVVTLAL